MSCELYEILQKFISSGLDMIALPSSQWLEGKCHKSVLIDAVQRAKSECGNCTCNLDPLYERALKLLNAQEDGYHFCKLVRDKIPEMIRKEGFAPKTRILGDAEYLSELNRKLREEIEEYIKDETPEEIADILEVIEAICCARGFGKEEILNIKQSKKESRGGFEKRLYLISKE